MNLRPCPIVLGLAVILAVSAPAGAVSRPGPDPGAALAYRAQLFHVTACPRDPVGDRFLGLSNLLVAMGRGGLKFYKAAVVSPVAGHAGIIAAGDVVVIKINYQWEQRGGTNVDLLRALVRAILDHPEGFRGEVVICDNTQFVDTAGFDRADNNAQDPGLSPHDVVADFQQRGYAVSHFDWSSIRATQVAEYSADDTTSGYVIEPYSDSWRGKLSYPKFRTRQGARVSLRYGVWDPAARTYDRSRLKFVNVPVLKSHHSRYGATACTKNYMGVVTDQFGTGSHASVQYGMMGGLMGEIQTADLNILDAIWINADPNTGPATTYAGATRRDELVAGLDPIALDIWAVKNILVPGFLANGFSPPWPSPSADPDLPSGDFRTYLDSSMGQLLAAGRQVTNDLGQIDALNADGAAGDLDHDGGVDIADFNRFTTCFTGPGGGPSPPGCEEADFDRDGDVDCDDWRMFKVVWMGATPPPQLPYCDVTGAPAAGGSAAAIWLARPNPNPMSAGTQIAYSTASRGPVRLEIYDLRGRAVARLVAEDQPGGRHQAQWDGRDRNGDPVASGVYFCRLCAGGTVLIRRLTLVR